MKMEQKFLEKDNVQIYYEILQGKQTLVFLHGTTVNHTVFNKLIDYFKDKYGILAIDQRGDGKSLPKSDDESFYSLENYTQDLENVIEKEGIEKPIIMGHSMGGMVGINYASRNDNINSLVLIETSYDFKKTLTLGGKIFCFPLFRPVFRWYFDHLNKKAKKRGIKDDYVDFSELDKVNDNDFARITYEKVSRDYAKAMWALSEAVLKWNVEEQLSSINCPTLILNAYRSQFIKLKTAYELQEKIGDNSHAKPIFGVKHQLLFQNADRVNKVIESFLENN